MIERTVLSAIGVLLIVTSLNDVFQSVIVPRAVGRLLRPSVYTTRSLWAIWRRVGHSAIKSGDAREDFLAVFSPANLIFSLLMWSLMLLLGYGLLFYVLREDVHPQIVSLGEAIYFAGTSFFTIGFGDYYGTNGWTRALALLAGGSGFGVISTTTAYLFSIFGAFQVREQFVVTIGARAGSPPSGVGLLTIAAVSQTVDSLPDVMREGEKWCAQILETHLAYPVLNYFRSSHDYESWVGTLGTLLDTAVLMMTTVECKNGEARILYNIGRHAARDLAHYLDLFNDDDARDSMVTREEYDDARRRMRDAGLSLREPDEAWEKFCRLRAGYAGHLNALANFFDIPSVAWTGEKPFIQSDHMRDQLDEKTLERLDRV